MSVPVVLITGGLTGIGRATAFAFAKEGANIVVSGRREAEGTSLEAELRASGAEAFFIKADVRHDAEVGRLVDESVACFGRIDVAVNNAGTEGVPGPIVDQTAESYAATFDTNVLGVLLSLKHELRVMLPQGRGSIVNISSFRPFRRAGCVGLRGQQTCGGGFYQIRRFGGCGVGRAGECRRSGADRYGYARPLHRQRTEQGGIGVEGSARAGRPAR